MNVIFTDGVILSEIMSGTGQGATLFHTSDLTHGTPCVSLTVTMQAGQMGYVPWAVAEPKEGKVKLINLALAEWVTLGEEP